MKLDCPRTFFRLRFKIGDKESHCPSVFRVVVDEALQVSAGATKANRELGS